MRKSRIKNQMVLLLVFLLVTGSSFPAYAETSFSILHVDDYISSEQRLLQRYLCLCSLQFHFARAVSGQDLLSRKQD